MYKKTHNYTLDSKLMYKKYVMANIQIPIELLEDNSLLPLSEYMTIEINKCDTLPEKKDTQCPSLLEKINALFTSHIDNPSINDTELSISLNDISTKKTKPRNNTSFKNVPSSKSRYTLKHRA